MNIDKNIENVKPKVDIRLTVFTDYYATEKKELTLSISGLYEHLFITRAPIKSQLPLVSGCRFGDLKTDKGSLRHDANVLGINAIIAEHDAGTMPFQQAVSLLSRAGVLCVMFTTPSHTAAAPRWRAVVPLSSEQPPSAHGFLVDRLNGVLQGALARESWTISQSFYAGFLESGPDQHIEIVQ